MGASGCKLRSAEERPSHKRARDDEDEEETQENTDPQEKKARVEEPSEYQKGLENWTKEIRMQQLRSFVSDPRDLVDLYILLDSLSQGALDLNSKWNPGAEETVFMVLLRFADQRKSYYSGDVVKKMVKMIENGDGDIDVNLHYSDGSTPLILALECAEHSPDCPLVHALIERSTPDIINAQDVNLMSAASIVVKNISRFHPQETVKMLRKLETHGCDLNLLHSYGETLLHLIVHQGAYASLLMLMEADLAGFDWQIRNSSNRTALQLARDMASSDNIPVLWVPGRGHVNVQVEEITRVHRLMQDWDNRWRNITRANLDEHFPPDLRKIMCQYLDGTGDKFKSREEEEEAERQNSELEDIINGTKPFIAPSLGDLPQLPAAQS